MRGGNELKRDIGFELDLSSSYLDIEKSIESYMEQLSRIRDSHNRRLIEKLSSSQLRKIHEYISKLRGTLLEVCLKDLKSDTRKIESYKKDLMKFKIFLTYQESRLASREGGEIYKTISKWFRNAVIEVAKVVKELEKEQIEEKSKNLEKVKELVEKMYVVSEALIAYHRYYGGE